jgi:hypothetical protein
LQSLQHGSKKLFFIITLLLFSSLLFPPLAAQKGEKRIETINIILPDKSSAVLQNIASIMKRVILQRSNIKFSSDKDASLNIELKIDYNHLSSEAYRIENKKTDVIRISGGDERGVLYGVGKFLRNSRFDQDSFTPGLWQGTSSPECTVRAIYLATHFNNYYEAVAEEELIQYIQDIGLMGYNAIIIAYPAWQFNSMQDESSMAWLKRFKKILSAAKQCGLKIGLTQCPNQGYKSTPEALRSQPVPGNHRGNFGINLCTSKPQARDLMLNMFDKLFNQFKDIKLDFLTLWPYDEGGCGCDACWPWGARGFLEISKEVSKLVRHKFPDCKIILSTWCFENENDDNPDGEWAGLSKSLQKDNTWIDYIMADGHNNYFPKYILEQGVPGNLPLINFPEISMFGMSPWGGYGANPAPAHFQGLWNRIKHIDDGGSPYSEGIYEDINKAIVAGFYWDKERKAIESVREYLSFHFSPLAADSLLEVVKIFEANHNRKNIHNSAIHAFNLVENAQENLTEAVKKSWRWRIFYLRALIDKELYQREGKLEGENLKAAFAELMRLYHAQNAHSMPIKPPTIK